MKAWLEFDERRATGVRRSDFICAADEIGVSGGAARVTLTPYRRATAPVRGVS